MKKEIKFSSISFDIITENGLQKHEYKWDKTNNTLTYYIDSIQQCVFNEKEARKKIKELIGKQKKTNKVVDKEPEKQITIEDNTNQLNLF